MEVKPALSVIVERAEERDALDVVPVEMRKEDVSKHRLLAKLGREAFAEIAESGAAIEDVDVPVDAHFDAGR